MNRHLLFRKIKNLVFKYTVFTLAVLSTIPLLLILYYLGKREFLRLIGIS